MAPQSPLSTRSALQPSESLGELGTLFELATVRIRRRVAFWLWGDLYGASLSSLFPYRQPLICVCRATAAERVAASFALTSRQQPGSTVSERMTDSYLVRLASTCSFSLGFYPSPVSNRGYLRRLFDIDSSIVRITFEKRIS